MSEEDIYWVFARREPGQPLSQIGIVKAASPGLAYVYAQHNYTERQWLDLCIAAKSAFFFGVPEPASLSTEAGS
ncbi:MAG TPA: hypothetical protein VIR57_19075 [Chloroflexota bacterium]